jgi:hypothetical protein
MFDRPAFDLVCQADVVSRCFVPKAAIFPTEFHAMDEVENDAGGNGR